MNAVFLGKPIHWILLIVLVALGWYTGLDKLHVIHFNTFLAGLLVVTLAVIVAVLRTTRSEEQVTRDPLPDDTDQQSLAVEAD